MNKAFSKILLIAFFFTLIVASYAIASNHFTLYTWSSITFVPILLIYSFSITKVRPTQIYYYLFMLISWVADILTLSSNAKLFYLGVSLYTFSYLLLGGIFYKRLVNNVHKYFSESYYVVSILLIIIILMIYFNNSYTDILIIVQQVIHVFVWITLAYQSFKLRERLSYKFYFIPAVIVILLSNILYAVDQLALNRKYPLVEAFDTFLYGTYLLLVSFAVKRYNEK